MKSFLIALGLFLAAFLAAGCGGPADEAASGTSTGVVGGAAPAPGTPGAPGAPVDPAAGQAPAVDPQLADSSNQGLEEIQPGQAGTR